MAIVWHTLELMNRLLQFVDLFRRSLFARLLKLPRPKYGVEVERNIPIMMADGVRLLTDHYRPRADGAFPTILIRTPYGRGKEVALGGGYPLSELPAQRLAERGYHVVVQGTRGRFDSDGEFTPHLNEAADGRDTVTWISEQPWFNGVLGSWGPSYLGYTQWATAAGAGEFLKAMVPAITSAENFSVSHADGAFCLETRLRWSQGIVATKSSHGRSLWTVLSQRFFGGAEKKLRRAFDHLPLLEADRVAAGEDIPFFRDILNHNQPDDPFWIARDHRECVSRVQAQIHFIGGWYDYYLRGLLRDYASVKAAGRRPYLTIGPWNHGNAGGMMAALREGLTWFDAGLKGDDGYLRQSPVRLYVMGADEWREMDEYPPPSSEVRYWLQDDGKLSLEKPATNSTPDRYVYDPADPTPALGGALLALRGAGAQDNRLLEARNDVLCYTTSPLAQELEVIGPVRLVLFVRSSLSFTDFFGRVCDVSPNGRSTNICDGLFRITPGLGEVQEDGSLRIEIDLWATAHLFRPGQRLRLQVSSGAHPRWSRNLGTGEPLATGVKSVVAEQTVYHDARHPSALILPVTNA